MDRIVQLLPNNALAVNLDQLADRLLKLSEKLRAGELGEVERVVVLLETDKVNYKAYGRPTTNMELVGLLEYAKHNVLI